MKPRTIIAAGILGLALAGMLLPISYMASPDWEVLVVDEQGKPLQGMTVRLSYRNYSAELLDHGIDGVPTARGSVLDWTGSPDRLESRIVATVW